MNNKLTTREQLELIDALPHGPEREKMLRLMLAEAWHEGWECAYGDGGQDNNAYMTGREIRDRQKQAEADHAAYVMAQVTGSRSATYSHTEPDGSTVEGSWQRP